MNYWYDKRVLVTGAFGFLGRSVVAALREKGCEHIFEVRSKEFDLTKEQDVERLTGHVSHRARAVSGDDCCRGSVLDDCCLHTPKTLPARLYLRLSTNLLGPLAGWRMRTSRGPADRVHG